MTHTDRNDPMSHGTKRRALRLAALVLAAVIAGSGAAGWAPAAEAAAPAQTPQEEMAAAEKLAETNPAAAAIAYGRIPDNKEARARSLELWQQVATHHTVAETDFYTAAIRSDGTMVTAGTSYEWGRGDVDTWTDMVAIAGGPVTMAGLRSDGTVLAAGSYSYVNDNWTDIVQIDVGDNLIVGLKKDGTVLACGDNGWGECEVSDWTDIMAVAGGSDITFGLRTDGTVVSTDPDDRYGVSGWSDIVALAAGSNHVVGLRSDGTVVAGGNNDDGQCNVYDWSGIVAIAAGKGFTLGLRSYGTVAACGNDDYYGDWNSESGHIGVESWTGIVDLSAYGGHMTGLTAYGTVSQIGTNYHYFYGSNDVFSEFYDLKAPTGLPTVMLDPALRAEAEAEAPVEDSAYRAPEELGTDPTSMIFELDGLLYQLPVPFSVFADEGWNFATEADSCIVMEPGETTNVILDRSSTDEVIGVSFKNYSDGAAYLWECHVTGLRARLSKVMSMAIPEIDGGIWLGMDGTCKEIIDASEIVYHSSENTDPVGRRYNVYRNPDDYIADPSVAGNIRLIYSAQDDMIIDIQLRYTEPLPY